MEDSKKVTECRSHPKQPWLAALPRLAMILCSKGMVSASKITITLNVLDICIFQHTTVDVHHSMTLSEICCNIPLLLRMMTLECEHSNPNWYTGHRNRSLLVVFITSPQKRRTILSLERIKLIKQDWLPCLLLLTTRWCAYFASGCLSIAPIICYFLFSTICLVLTLRCLYLRNI